MKDMTVLYPNLDIRMSIEYADANGEVTERKIKVSSIITNGSYLYLKSYCFLDKGPRQFRVDRVLKYTIDSVEPVEAMNAIFNGNGQEIIALIDKNMNNVY